MNEKPWIEFFSNLLELFNIGNEIISKRIKTYENNVKEVDKKTASALSSFDKEVSIQQGPLISVLNLDDKTSFQEITMTKEDKEKWNASLSLLFGEGLKSTLSALGPHGLLKCDLPIEMLVKNQQNPHQMRGFVINDGKISQQANFMEVGLSASQIAQLSFQCLSMITSQYYMHIISEKLSDINNKINDIIIIFDAKEQSTLQTAISDIFDICRKSNYTDDDYNRVCLYTHEIFNVKNFYQNRIKNVQIESQLQKTNLEEVNCLLKSLNDSGYLKNLKLAYQADLIFFLANICKINIARRLGRNEDAEVAINKLEVGLWNFYGRQFVEIKTKVLEFIKCKRNDSGIGKNKIVNLLNQYTNTFSEIESDLKSLDKQILPKIPTYIGLTSQGDFTLYKKRNSII